MKEQEEEVVVEEKYELELEHIAHIDFVHSYCYWLIVMKLEVDLL